VFLGSSSNLGTATVCAGVCLLLGCSVIRPVGGPRYKREYPLDISKKVLPLYNMAIYPQRKHEKALGLKGIYHTYKPRCGSRENVVVVVWPFKEGYHYGLYHPSGYWLAPHLYKWERRDYGSALARDLNKLLRVARVAGVVPSEALEVNRPEEITRSRNEAFYAKENV